MISHDDSFHGLAREIIKDELTNLLVRFELRLL